MTQQNQLFLVWPILLGLIKRMAIHAIQLFHFHIICTDSADCMLYIVALYRETGRKFEAAVPHSIAVHFDNTRGFWDINAYL